jgi:hypothetical protein
MALLYGYVVCLIAVVTFIIGTSNFVDAAFERANPLASNRGMYGPGGAQLTSFEAFRASYAGRGPVSERPTGQAPGADTVSTAELQRRYEALRADHIGQVRYQSTQRMVKHGLLMLLAVVLFATHWRWVRGQREAPAA